MKASKKIKVDDLRPGDVFFTSDGKRHDVIENIKISSSFNELITLSESKQENIRLKKGGAIKPLLFSYNVHEPSTYYPHHRE